MDEAKLAEVEEWANDHVPRCYGCDGIARVIVPGTSRPMCAACAPNVPGAVLPLVSVYATTLDLVAEVRRLTAALDAARREGAEGMREVVKAEIHAAFHYNDPPDDGRERPIAPRAGEWEAHQTLRKLLSRVCVVLTEGGAS